MFVSESSDKMATMQSLFGLTKQNYLPPALHVALIEASGELYMVGSGKDKGDKQDRHLPSQVDACQGCRFQMPAAHKESTMHTPSLAHWKERCSHGETGSKGSLDMGTRMFPS